MSRSTLITRAAVRFALVYYLLYAVGTQIVENMLMLPSGAYVGKHTAYRLVSWVGAHLFGLRDVNADGGSNDRIFDWLQLLTFVSVAAIAALVWLAVDRRRTAAAASGGGPAYDARVDAWLRTLLRFALGSVLAFYGGIKLWPVQMSALSLTQLFQPVGSLTPQDLLWVSVGAVPAYEVAIGAVEVAAAFLLFVPRTASLGAVLASLELGYIFALDLAYDLPVKLWAFQLLLMAVILAAPVVPALWDVLMHREVCVPGSPAPLFASPKRARAAVFGQIALGAWILAMNLINAEREWAGRGVVNIASAPLYGAWLSSSNAAWPRVIFERGGAFFQRPDQTFAGFDAAIDRDAGTVTLTATHGGPSGLLRFALTDADRLVLDGQVEGRAVHLELQRIDTSQLPLVSHRFHLSQEAPVAK